MNKGSVGSILDEKLSERSSLNSQDDDEEENQRKDNKQDGNSTNLSNNTNPFFLNNNMNQYDIGNDYKWYIPGEGSGKEFLKKEIEKMMEILRVKHEICIGVHLFKRVDYNQKQEKVQAKKNKKKDSKFDKVRNVKPRFEEV